MTTAIDNELNIIDFSNGIRPEEIQENFEILENQIQRERRNVGGPGISSGLEVTIEVDEINFGVTISSASIITNDGKEIFIPETKIDIDKPKLIQEKEYLNANYNNQFELKHIPYATNGRTISQFSNTYLSEDTGLQIRYQDSTSDNDSIKVTSIIKNAITVSRLTRRDLEVVYNYSAKRIDTLYIDNDYNIRVASGVTSTTPSAVIPKEFKFLIAFLEIDAYAVDSNNRMYANIAYRKDLRQVRNIYTDSTGKLWICGTPFEDLQIIHMTEPADPSPNTMWYDAYSNQIKIWRATDKLVYMNSYEVTTDYSLYPEATQDYDTDMYYEVGGEQLHVYVNDIELDSSEFAELNELKLPVDKLDIERGKLSIGVPSNIGSFFLFDKIMDFHQKFPNIEITIITGSTSNLINLLDTHKVDFVIDTSPINVRLDEGMKVTKLKAVQYCFIVKKDTRILKTSDITSLKDLVKYPLILPISGTANRNDLDNILKDNNINIQNVINIHTSEMIISAVKKDLGIGYVIYNLVENEIKSNEIEVLNIKEKLPTVDINIVYDPYFLTTAPKRFIEDYIDYNLEL